MGGALVTEMPLAEEDARALAARRVADLVRRARLKRNPLYLWQAIAQCYVHGLPLPSVCEAELQGFALAMNDLALGLDPRNNQQQPSEGETHEAFVTRRRNRYLKAEAEGAREITPEATAQTIPQLLGFVRRGWNAFAEIYEDRACEGDAGSFDAAVVFGRGTEEVMKKRKREAHPRTIKRRLQRGRQMLGVTKPPTT